MLSQTYSLKPVILGVLMALSSAVYAQNEQQEVTAENIELPNYLPLGGLSAVSEVDLLQAKKDGISMVKDILSAYETQRTPEMTEFALDTKRRVDTIADAAMENDRAEILRFLGVDPEGDTTLYYFLSWSMPLEMLRSYTVEAMWTGGTVVFKGVPPGKKLGEFLTKDLRQLVYGKGAAANISVDPRLFDAYSVSTVPTIVFTTERENMQCQGISAVPVSVGDFSGSYDECPPLDPSKFWKIAGSVTSSFALNAFIEDGAHKAQPHLDALARGWAGQKEPGKVQKPFVSRWEDAISPSELKAAQEAAQQVQMLGNTP